MSQQRNLKSGKSGRSRRLRARRRGPYPPAGLRGARVWRRAHAQHEKWHTGGFREKLQASTGGQIEFLGRSPRRNHNGPQRGAACRLGSRAQDARAIADPNQQKALGSEPQFSQTRWINRPGLTISKLLPDPAQGTPFARPAGQNARKSRRIDAILDTGGINFMDRPTFQSAVQMTVERGKAQGKMPTRRPSACGRARPEGRGQITGKEGSSHHTGTYVHFTFHNSRFIRG